MDAGRSSAAATRARVAAQFWSALHGYVMLELAGMHPVSKDPAEEVLRPLMTSLVAGLGPAARVP